MRVYKNTTPIGILKKFVLKYKQSKIIKLFGKIDYVEDYNYKDQRNNHKKFENHYVKGK